jgi:hypothetical protein
VSYITGLVPPEAEIGDLICHFWNCEVVALLRQEIESEVYRIVGRVHLSTGNLDQRLVPIYEKWKISVKGAKSLLVQMDIGSLHILTC